MNNTISLYHLAKLFKDNNIKPVHDVWFCFTAGEEGRGNLAGMKQLYGYNQDNGAAIPADNGRNKLNIMANLSIDGGFMTFMFLGSYRYEINYKGVNGAREAARRIAQIADVIAPQEDTPPSSTLRTTYTVGVAYKKDDGSTSFEIDMRSPQSGDLNVMQTRLYPKFGVGETADGVEAIAALWFGDRPAHVHSDTAISTDPLIYTAWRTYCDLNPISPAGGSRDTDSDGCRDLPSGENDATSLNDNIPGAMDIPTVNMSLATTAHGGGHAFNEWAIRGQLASEVSNMSRILYTLLTVSGLADTNGVQLVPPAYPNAIGVKHTDEVWDEENIWQ